MSKLHRNCRMAKSFLGKNGKKNLKFNYLKNEKKMKKINFNYRNKGLIEVFSLEWVQFNLQIQFFYAYNP